jgi:hypothetical protein
MPGGKIIILSILMLIGCISCKDSSIITDEVSIDIQLSKNQSYEYNPLIGGDEDGLSISTQAIHFDISEIVRDSSTNYMAIYRYKPAMDYVGKDSVEIKISTGSDGASPPTHIDYITINFTILTLNKK